MDIRLSNRERKELISQLRDMAHPNQSFFALMTLATLIAAYGLLANSTAVVIGAMLIAPLMGPIFGITLALIIGDRRLLFDSMLAEAAGVVLAILIGVFVGSLPFIPEFGNEILSRTQPTLFDVVIALASGLAGAYVLVNPKLNSGIAGVAIATALVPPLAVCGLEIAAGGWDAAGSAFLLFITNFFAILLSAAVVFMVAGVERVHEPGPSYWLHVLRTFGPGIVALVGLTVILSIRLVDIVSTKELRSLVLERITEQLAIEVKGAELSVDDSEIDLKTDPISIRAVVLSSRAIDEGTVVRIQEAVQAATGRSVDLLVRTYTTYDYKASGRWYWTDDEKVRAEQLAQQKKNEEQLDRMRTALQNYLSGMPGAFLVHLLRDSTLADGRLAFTAEIEATNAITPGQVREMQDSIAASLPPNQQGEVPKIYLRVRQDNVRYADADGYIFEASEQPLPPVEFLAMKEQLRRTLQQQLEELQPGSGLEDLNHFPGPDLRLQLAGFSGPVQQVRIVQATVHSPVMFQPAELQQLEQALTRRIGEPVWLQLDNYVRSYIDSGGYRQDFSRMQPSEGS